MNTGSNKWIILISAIVILFAGVGMIYYVRFRKTTTASVADVAATVGTAIPVLKATIGTKIQASPSAQAAAQNFLNSLSGSNQSAPAKPTAAQLYASLSPAAKAILNGPSVQTHMGGNLKNRIPPTYVTTWIIGNPKKIPAATCVALTKEINIYLQQLAIEKNATKYPPGEANSYWAGAQLNTAKGDYEARLVTSESEPWSLEGIGLAHQAQAGAPKGAAVIGSGETQGSHLN